MQKTATLSILTYLLDFHKQKESWKLLRKVNSDSYLYLKLFYCAISI